MKGLVRAYLCVQSFDHVFVRYQPSLEIRNRPVFKYPESIQEPGFFFYQVWSCLTFSVTPPAFCGAPTDSLPLPMM